MADTTKPFSIYHSLDASKQEIRVLHLLPARDLDAPIHVEVKTVSLKDKPYYEALSYTWGDPNDTTEIWSRDTQTSSPESSPDTENSFASSTDAPPESVKILVTKSLHGALRRLRWNCRIRVVWADAICVNQVDSTEKSQQVSMMGDIYQAAKSVKIWLGEDGSPRTKRWRDLALRGYLWDLSKEMEDPGVPARDLWSVNDMSSATVQGWQAACIREYREDMELTVEGWQPKAANDAGLKITDIMILALFHVLMRPWFSRLWVIQEVILAKRADFILGSSVLPFRLVVAASNKVVSSAIDRPNHSQLLILLLRGIRNIELLTLLESISTVVSVQQQAQPLQPQLRQLEAEQRQWEAEQRQWEAEQRQWEAEQRQVQALSEQVKQLEAELQKAQAQLEHSKQFEAKRQHLSNQLSTLAGDKRYSRIRLLLESQSEMLMDTWMTLKLLSTCGRQYCTDPKDRVYALLSITLLRSHVQVDYTKTVDGVYVDAATALLRNKGSLVNVLYYASLYAAITNGTPYWVPGWRTTMRLERWPRIPSFYNASIAHEALVRGSRLETKALRIDTIAECLPAQESAELCNTPLQQKLQLWRQWLGNESAEAFWRVVMLDAWEDGSRRLTKQDLTTLLNTFEQDSDGNFIRPDHVVGLVVEIGRAFDSIIHRPCRTDRGHVGAIGFSGDVGDEVYIVAGCRMPVILRPATTHGPKHYRFIELCYIRGVMDGEAVSEAMRAQGKEEPIDVFEDVFLV
ncbi:Non-essential glycogen phosphorylase [Elasticomyces elasticus]|nr:Non-essential glycogen phosphorylase [Elasticomyces elasticus]